MATIKHYIRAIIVRSFMFCILIGFSQELRAQNLIPISSPQKPVLIDDTNVDAMLQFKSQTDYASVLDKYPTLNEKQRKQIARVEKCRNKHLTSIDKQIEKANLSLKKQKSKLSDNALNRRINHIANLHIKRQDTISKVKSRIERLLQKGNS